MLIELGAGERLELLQIARRAIEDHLNGEAGRQAPSQSRDLGKPGAAFVTLLQGGDLRGCIGCIQALYPLHETVARCAVAAASEDPRFPPLTVAELVGLRISISVLSPLRALERIESVEIGRHGLLVERDGRRGLLLPEVAVNWAWDRETFLGQTCRKAGFAVDAWRKREVKIFTFETCSFSESDPVVP